MGSRSCSSAYRTSAGRPEQEPADDAPSWQRPFVAKPLKCPNCGEPFTTMDGACSYCGAASYAIAT